MKRWRSANRWLVERPAVLIALSGLVLLWLWVLAIWSGQPLSYAFAVIWSVLVLVVKPIQNRHRR